MKKPNYTQVPNEFIDTYQRQLSGAATKVFNSICRKTIGYHKDCEIISQGDMQELTGLSLNSVKNAVKELEDKDLVKSWKKGKGKNTKTYYELYFGDSMSKIDIELDSNGSIIDTLNSSNGSEIDTLNGSNVSEIDTFINKRNLKEKEEKESPSTPSRSKTDFDHYDLQAAINSWNRIAEVYPVLVRYRYLAANVKPERAREILATLSVYAADEFEEAVMNYAKIISDSSKYDARPFYDSGFEGFASSGVKMYVNESRPFNRCSVTGEAQGPVETPDEKRRRLNTA